MSNSYRPSSSLDQIHIQLQDMIRLPDRYYNVYFSCCCFAISKILVLAWLRKDLLYGDKHKHLSISYQLHWLDCQSIGSVMNSVLTSCVINRGLDCQSIGSVMNSVLHGV